MAEAFGVVAGGFSILQISSKLITLQQLWEDVRDVPKITSNVLDEIHHLAALLAEVDAESHALCTHSAGEHIRRWCQVALDDLTILINDLSSELGQGRRLKRGALQVKISLRRDFWLKIEGRLSKIVRMLSLVHETYLIAITKQQNHLMLSRLESACNTIESSCRKGKPLLEAPSANQQHHSSEIQRSFEDHSTCGVFDRSDSVIPWVGSSVLGWIYTGTIKLEPENLRDKNNQVHTRRPQRYIQIRPPSWLSTKAWDYLLSNSFVGWKSHLRSYSIVAQDAPVFQLAAEGDIDGLLDLFDKGLASPFDRNDLGHTLLSHAYSRRRYSSVSVMISWGLDFAALFDPFANAGWPFQYLGDSDWSNIHQLALNHGAYDEFSDLWSSIHGYPRATTGPIYILVRSAYSCNPEAVRLTLHHLRPEHYKSELLERLQFFSFCRGRGPSAYFETNPDAFRYMLWKDGKLSVLDILKGDEIGIPIIVIIAWNYRITNPSSSVSIKAQQSWRKLARAFIPFTTRFHLFPPTFWVTERLWTCDCMGLPTITTPLLEIIGLPYFFPVNCLPGSYCGDFTSWRRNVERALADWLEDLSVSGIDLNEYGALEKHIFTGNIGNWRPPEDHYMNCAVSPWAMVWKLEDFTYGPEPKDWYFSWDLSVEAFVADFWNVIDSPYVHIVGAYPEENVGSYIRKSWNDELCAVGMGAPHRYPEGHEDGDSTGEIEVLDLEAESDSSYEDEGEEQTKLRKRTRTLKVVEELRQRKARQVMSNNYKVGKYDPEDGKDYSDVFDAFKIIER